MDEKIVNEKCASEVNVNLLKEMNGQEVWTNAFGDRQCVGVDYPHVVIDGERITPTKAQIKELWDDMIRAEWGTNDLKTILRMEGFGDLLDAGAVE